MPVPSSARRSVLAGATLLVLSVPLPPMLQGRQGSTPPHIVLLVADDVGYDDVGYHNPLVRTRHLDRLCREGMELDRFYVAPVCSPTRMALLTGRFPIRWGMERHVLKPWDRVGLPGAELTLAELLTREGYGANLITGKWHLGHAYSRFHPLRHGFQRFLGNYHGEVDYYTHLRHGERDWHLDFDSRPEDDGKYHTDLVGDSAVEFIEDHAQDARPFFLYVPFLAAHSPLQAPAWAVKLYTRQGIREPRATHLAQVTVMDHAIGRILDALDETGIAAHTVVWFLSDNGGNTRLGASNWPLRGEKATVFEGGIRTPALVRYPGHLPAGVKSSVLLRAVDVLPTLRGIVRECTGEAPAADRPLDGIDFYPVWKGSQSPPDTEHCTYHSPLQDGAEDSCIVTSRNGQVGWKLIWSGPPFSLPPPSNAKISLHDVGSDPGETSNLAASHPEVVDDLLARLAAWRDLHPTDGRGLHGTEQPPNWVAPTEWRFADTPLPPGGHYLIYREGPSANEQRVAALYRGGGFRQLGTTRGGPDGRDDLFLGAIGLHPSEHLLYGMDSAGSDLYQIDAQGLVMYVGSVEGIPLGTRIQGGEFHPSGKEYYLFDEAEGRLCAVAMDRLTARWLPRLRTTSGARVEISDLQFLPPATLLAHESHSRQLLSIAEDGAVTPLRDVLSLGPCGAFWPGAGGTLLLYRSRPDGNASAPGLFELSLADGSLRRLSIGPTLWSVDGGGGVRRRP